MKKPVVVSDTTTLIVLEKQNNLSLLCQVFSQVHIPVQVHEELLAGSKNFDIAQFSCFQRRKVLPSSRFNNLSQLLDIGESAAIELAISEQLPLIIDEKKGRKIARQLGLAVTGFSGLLILAVQQQVLSSQEAIILLKNAKNSGYRLSNQLYDQVIMLLSEIKSDF
jgi:predicted nucleic acid-binding protein